MDKKNRKIEIYYKENKLGEREEIQEKVQNIKETNKNPNFMRFMI